MLVPVISFGGQYNHLIKRRLEELGARSTLIPYTSLDHVGDLGGFDGVVMGGGPQSLTSPQDPEALEHVVGVVRELDIPLLGICLSHHIVAYAFGGRVDRAAKPEYGSVEIVVDEPDDLFEGLPRRMLVWESHSDEVVEAPDRLITLAHSDNCGHEAFKHRTRPVYSVQFHPEVSHTRYGREILGNFLRVCRR